MSKALYGELTEWFKVSVLKTEGWKQPVGSNPTFAAICLSVTQSDSGLKCMTFFLPGTPERRRLFALGGCYV